MRTAQLLALVLISVWFGMVAAISFLEAPLKFRAPGVTLPIGLGIGRLVFRALNICELTFAAAIVIAMFSAHASTAATIAAATAIATLLVQVFGVRPALTRRSNAVLAGRVPPGAPRSHTHVIYVVLEIVKVFALLASGFALVQGLR